MMNTKPNSRSTIYTEHVVDGALPSCAVIGTESGWDRLSRLEPGRRVGGVCGGGAVCGVGGRMGGGGGRRGGEDSGMNVRILHPRYPPTLVKKS